MNQDSVGLGKNSVTINSVYCFSFFCFLLAQQTGTRNKKQETIKIMMPTSAQARAFCGAGTRRWYRRFS